MATIESKEIVAEILRNNGVYNDDRQAMFVSVCTIVGGKTVYHVAYSSDEMLSLYTSPAIEDFQILWQKDLGLSSHGWNFVNRS